MRKILVIGIGAGNPDHLTVQAVKALQTVDVYFVLDKGSVKQELVDLRASILEAHVTRPYRWVEGRDPERDRNPTDYVATIDAWRRARADVVLGLLSDLGEDEVDAAARVIRSGYTMPLLRVIGNVKSNARAGSSPVR